jgi:hypothetical protein
MTLTMLSISSCIRADKVDAGELDFPTWRTANDSKRRGDATLAGDPASNLRGGDRHPVHDGLKPVSIV